VTPASPPAGRPTTLSWLLRFAVFGCFVGHGLWGFVPKTAWLPFFDVFFVPHDVALPLMRVVGAIDVSVGVLALVHPTRALFVWAACWTIFTALLRPSAGMGMSEFFERAGNFGGPVALLALHPWPRRAADWFARVEAPAAIAPGVVARVRWILTAAIASLLIGHGGLALFVGKPLLLDHAAALGLAPSLAELRAFGALEIALGVLVLLRPGLPGLLGFVALYKLGTELLHPIAGAPIDALEAIERMGDYALPIALALILRAPAPAEPRRA
jgi:hypothetical protein